ncbi:S-adenosyl-L-methionine-dependent methyltransferases superfamily protein [Klebsormidium nitens]|uniref:S-adenosyl-L-methionine-dependent methyltransferases superfamily protein n=1 Tax=Klebsormidium nitens TaxID=105231 RepID=A0A1Y1ID33_KLENI|nr:S-adenosyl-L-methionine-dependent methyltransferases superfamily protein [Klebsormidium nitens]|eukprot:GAQ88864.1 S-adenosyl-L-methionine-dependent methyltransferases superfamily protein [Klebsormidium nitens]
MLTCKQHCQGTTLAFSGSTFHVGRERETEVLRKRSKGFGSWQSGAKHTHMQRTLASSGGGNAGSTYPGQANAEQKSDLYKEQAAAYIKWRPTYPATFLQGLAKLAPARELLWDVGTGSGQAAVGLAPHFDRVVATDVSPWQLAQAPRVSNVTYIVTSAEMGTEELAEVLGGLATVDLITVASALHFFDVHKMTQQALAALKPLGVYAPFTYNMPAFATPRLDVAMEAILVAMAGPNYRLEAAKRECNPLDGYKNMHFPFEPVEGRTETEPRLTHMRFVWRFENVVGFMESTSYAKRLAEMPTGKELLRELEAAWVAGGEEQEVVFKLWSRVGRKPK